MQASQQRGQTCHQLKTHFDTITLQIRTIFLHVPWTMLNTNLEPYKILQFKRKSFLSMISHKGLRSTPS